MALETQVGLLPGTYRPEPRRNFVNIFRNNIFLPRFPRDDCHVCRHSADLIFEILIHLAFRRYFLISCRMSLNGESFLKGPLIVGSDGTKIPATPLQAKTLKYSWISILVVLKNPSVIMVIASQDFGSDFSDWSTAGNYVSSGGRLTEESYRFTSAGDLSASISHLPNCFFRGLKYREE